MKIKNRQRVLHSTANRVNIFDNCTKWTIERAGSSRGEWTSSVAVVLETVCTFLGEWISTNERVPNWEPEIPTVCVQFYTRQTPVNSNYLIWVSQRELQRETAEMSSEEENLPGNPALIMLLILGFPLLQVKVVEDGEFCAYDSRVNVHDASASTYADMHRDMDLSVRTWRVERSISAKHFVDCLLGFR